MAEAQGLYRGYVENRIDPMNLGRVQVRVPSLYGAVESDEKVSTASLPWAVPGSLNCASNKAGQFLIPPVGSIVWVMFEDADPRKPVYFGGVFTTAEGDNPVSPIMSSPSQYVVFKTPDEEGYITYDTKEGVMTIKYYRNLRNHFQQ